MRVLCVSCHVRVLTSPTQQTSWPGTLSGVFEICCCATTHPFRTSVGETRRTTPGGKKTRQVATCRKKRDVTNALKVIPSGPTRPSGPRGRSSRNDNFRNRTRICWTTVGDSRRRCCNNQQQVRPWVVPKSMRMWSQPLRVPHEKRAPRQMNTHT